MYIFRLDDASEYMNKENWNQIESLLDKYNIKPIVGVIPNNKDTDMTQKYTKDKDFWDKVDKWKSKGWEIALHGYDHVCITDNGGINPVNNRSEFAGLSLEKQEKKIELGLGIFNSHNIEPKIFFSPSHTFDENTLTALKNKSDIKVISDTVANDIYKYNGFYFIPQQSGGVRNLKFKVTTFCYHPNTMVASDFSNLDEFFKLYADKFIDVNKLEFKQREKSIYDKILSFIYFSIRKLKNR